MLKVDGAIAHAYEQSKVDDDPKARQIYKNIADEMSAIKAKFESLGMEP